MKFLLTGMTSKHTSRAVHLNNLGFFGNLETALKDAFPDATIDWAQPSVLWEHKDLEKYDRVFVGIVPPTSISANHIYGALKTINILKDSNKLVKVVDHSDLWQYRTSFASIAKDSSYLGSSFYVKRKEYSKALDYLELLSDTANHLLEEDWGLTIYPALPWQEIEDVVGRLKLPISDLVGLNFDQYSVDKYEPTLERTRITGWAVSSNNSWFKRVAPSLSKPARLMKDSKKSSDSDVFDFISSTMGALIAPSDRNSGTWWSHRYIQSLLAQTPVATEWREAGVLGDSWNVLPYQIEDTSPSSRIDLALDQKNSYLASIGTKEDVKTQLQKLFSTNGEK